MDRPSSSPNHSRSRRFVLLPEEAAEGSNRRPQIRRYRLASIGRHDGLNGVDLATARIAGELSRLRRMGG